MAVVREVEIRLGDRARDLVYRTDNVSTNGAVDEIRKVEGQGRGREGACDVPLS